MALKIAIVKSVMPDPVFVPIFCVMCRWQFVFYGFLRTQRATRQALRTSFLLTSRHVKSQPFAVAVSITEHKLMSHTNGSHLLQHFCIKFLTRPPPSTRLNMFDLPFAAKDWALFFFVTLCELWMFFCGALRPVVQE